MVLLLFFIGVYFLPFIIALARRSPQTVAIFFLWAQAAPGREAAVLRAFQPGPPSGKPDIEPTPRNDRVSPQAGRSS
jgi:hypothetical protein